VCSSDLLYPESLAAHSNLGAVWYALGEYDRASDAWRQAIAIKPNAMSWGNLGAAYTYLKDYSAAELQQINCMQTWCLFWKRFFLTSDFIK
jgi:tetratricopeptide (TPR) repeat protein